MKRAKIHTSSFVHAIILNYILLSFPSCSCSVGKEVIFFSDPFYEGDRLFIKLGSGCYSIGGEWDNRISSVDTQGACIIAYEQRNCRGASVKLASGQNGLEHLGRISFDNTLRSISVCVNVTPIRARRIDGPVPEIWKFAVKEHNKYRRMHGVPDLRGDVQLYRTAQQHADYLVRNNKLEASSNKYGENLATSYEPDKFGAIRDAIERWYDKIAYYDFNNPESNKERSISGQFSSIVWKATTHMGIGIAQYERDKKWVVVANYDPPAKTKGYSENVPSPMRWEHV